MVNADGQLYTIEGLAASLILLLTAFLVVNSTSVYTQGDAHISDMQLEVTGSDALNMMSYAANISPNGKSSKSPLQEIIEKPDNTNKSRFVVMFDNITNNMTISGRDRIKFTANVSCQENDVIDTTMFLGMTRPLSGGEHAVRVSQWVIAETGCPPGSSSNIRKRAVLVEVLLWRD